MKNKVIKILEADKEKANKLLKTGNCKLIGVVNVSTNNKDCLNETKLLYSIAQVKYGNCPLCGDSTLEYDCNYSGKCIITHCTKGHYNGQL